MHDLLHRRAADGGVQQPDETDEHDRGDDEQTYVLGDDRGVAGGLSRRASSPKASPGPRVANLRPWRVTRAVPSRITKNSWPVSPSEMRALPAGDLTSSARRATSWRSLREQAAKSGTCWRWSMNASRRAMGRESNESRRTRHCLTPAILRVPRHDPGISAVGESDNAIVKLYSSFHSTLSSLEANHVQGRRHRPRHHQLSRLGARGR